MGGVKILNYVRHAAPLVKHVVVLTLVDRRTYKSERVFSIDSLLLILSKSRVRCSFLLSGIVFCDKTSNASLSRRHSRRKYPSINNALTM